MTDTDSFGFTDGGGPVSADTDNLLAEYGIDLSRLQNGMASDEPPVFLGHLGGRTGRSASALQNRVVPRDEALLEPFRWKPEDLEKFQRRMFDAGLYGNLDEREIRWRTVDPYTEAAWEQLVNTAARYYAVGKKLRPQDVLDELAATGMPGGPGEEPGKPTNDLDVRALGRETAKDVLGQDLTPDQQRQFAGRFRSMEAPHLTDAAGQLPPNPEEWARQNVRALDPVRADSRSVVSAFDQIAQLMRGEA